MLWLIGIQGSANFASRMSIPSRKLSRLTVPFALTILCCVSVTAAHAQATAPALPQAPAAVQAPTRPPEALPTPAQKKRASEPQFFVVIDPAHGGTNNGATLASGLPEKNYTLALAGRLRALLNARGIHTVLTHTSDIDLDDTTRAVIANRARAAACILIHATATGNGIHLFTSSLAPPVSPAPSIRRSFLPWQTAQASFVTESLRLESDVNSALKRQHFPVLLNRTALMPLDSMACPAVAVEVAPLDEKISLSDAGYQQKVAQALASALVAWRGDWRPQP